jgi:hypothetical protein
LQVAQDAVSGRQRGFESVEIPPLVPAQRTVSIASGSQEPYALDNAAEGTSRVAEG